jgi:UDP-N-acetylglucosamine 4-epimerase
MNACEKVCRQLRRNPRRWLVTGVAGFIGSHLLEKLLGLDQTVVGLDNFDTGFRKNLEAVRERVSPSVWKRFRFEEGDIRDSGICRRITRGIDHILHHAALASVPRSLRDPVATNAINVDGLLNILVAARDCRVKRVVYASSSAVYGDDPRLPKTEEVIGHPLSPYAASKRINEIHADVFGQAYGMETVGLRYFNVFGLRQDPNGPYAAVIPRWVEALLEGKTVEIYGDGRTSRDFCYVANVVQANLLASVVVDRSAVNQVYNIASGRRTTLNGLFRELQRLLAEGRPDIRDRRPAYRAFRQGDIRHSLADIRKVRARLGYAPTHDLQAGLAEMFCPGSGPSSVVES